MSLIAAGSAGSGYGMQATTPRPTVTLLNRSATTVTGQNISLPQGAVEVVITRTLIPAGGSLPMHKHPWPRYAIVESGRLRVHWEQAGLTREFGPGEAVIEAIDQWHEGVAIGPEAVRLIVVDQVPPGATNLVRR
ncbi:MAG: cupin domain-containing protein [Allosphingosinicella sp.]